MDVGTMTNMAHIANSLMVIENECNNNEFLAFLWVPFCRFCTFCFRFYIFFSLGYLPR